MLFRNGLMKESNNQSNEKKEQWNLKHLLGDPQVIQTNDLAKETTTPKKDLTDDFFKDQQRARTRIIILVNEKLCSRALEKDKKWMNVYNKPIITWRLSYHWS